MNYDGVILSIINEKMLKDKQIDEETYEKIQRRIRDSKGKKGFDKNKGIYYNENAM